MSKSWAQNDMPTVRMSILFCVRPQDRPRFWMADTRSRKTKAVKVYTTILCVRAVHTGHIAGDPLYLR